LVLLIILAAHSYLRAQETQPGADGTTVEGFKSLKMGDIEVAEGSSAENTLLPAASAFRSDARKESSGSNPDWKDATRFFDKPKPAPTPPVDYPKSNGSAERFHWKPALTQSLIFLGVQHSFRLTQQKTRAQLGGPFLKDWGRSVKGIQGWPDGDDSFTNYFAHPMQGAFTGRIFVNNSDKAKKQEFGWKKDYWNSRLKAMTWTAIWSAQFEIGPLSEASIGNVGMYRTKNGINTGAYVDFVITPVMGTGVLVAEDAIDKYILKKWLEGRTGGKATMQIKVLRSLLTPTTSIGNLIRFRVPWQRDSRSN